MKNFIIKADFHLNVFHYYKILKVLVFEYFCNPISKFKYLRIFSKLDHHVHIKRSNLPPKPLFLATTEKTVLDESVVVSGAGYAIVLGNEDYSYMERGLRYCVTLI